jgi:hypothetical protein
MERDQGSGTRLVERMERLERRNRWLKGSLGVLALLAGALAAAPPGRVEVTASEFVLRDDDGNPVGELLLNDKRVHFGLKAPKADTQVDLIVDPDGPWFALGWDGNISLRVSGIEQKLGVWLLEAGESVEAVSLLLHRQEPALMLFERGADRPQLHAGVHRPCSFLVLAEGTNKPRLLLATPAQLDATLLFCNPDQKPRLRFVEYPVATGICLDSGVSLYGSLTVLPGRRPGFGLQRDNDSFRGGWLVEDGAGFLTILGKDGRTLFRKP